MVISRSPAAKLAAEGLLCFDGVPLPLQEAVKILGKVVDPKLRFDGHIKHIAYKASHRVTVLRRMAGFLYKEGKLLLYKAKIRPYLEYASLSWMSCASSHTRKLDSIQCRTLRLVDAEDSTTQSVSKSSWLTGTPQGRRGASGVPQAIGTGSATRVTPGSTSRQTEHGNGAS